MISISIIVPHLLRVHLLQVNSRGDVLDTKQNIESLYREQKMQLKKEEKIPHSLAMTQYESEE